MHPYVLVNSHVMGAFVGSWCVTEWLFLYIITLNCCLEVLLFAVLL